MLCIGFDQRPLPSTSFTQLTLLRPPLAGVPLEPLQDPVLPPSLSPPAFVKRRLRCGADSRRPLRGLRSSDEVVDEMVEVDERIVEGGVEKGKEREEF